MGIDNYGPQLLQGLGQGQAGAWPASGGFPAVLFAQWGLIEGPEAKATAEALLIRQLTPKQLEEWKQVGGFWVRSRSGTMYWLDAQGVHRCDSNGVFLEYFCIAPNEADGTPLPLGDRILARKILLETDEAKFLKTANARPITQMRAPIVPPGKVTGPLTAPPFEQPVHQTLLAKVRALLRMG